MLIFAFGVGVLPLVYITSNYFDTPSSGFVFVTIVHLCLGLILSIVFLFIHFVNLIAENGSANKWEPYLRFIPIFAFLFGTQKMYTLGSFNTLLCKNFPVELCNPALFNLTKSRDTQLSCCPELCGDKCYFPSHALRLAPFYSGYEVLTLFCTGLVVFTLLVLYDSKWQQVQFVFVYLYL